ncbi:VMA9 [Sanghuangporus vaninii]
MASGFPVIALLVIVLGLMAVTWLATPKGPQQTLIRTAVLLALSCCYLMWMVTYMAQLHPLMGMSTTSPISTSPFFIHSTLFLGHLCIYSTKANDT